MTEVNGVINVYKPSGLTSFDVVRRIKSITGIKKVGHTGTLDPLASGVLPICIGKATKAVDYIMSESKEYVAEMKLGIITDTYDREGSVIHEESFCLKEEDVISAIYSFKGEIEQVPPMYSALKVKGKRLYELAREGITIERQSRIINIYDIDIINISIPFVKFKVKCSKGTYIRSLCYDIGEKLKCGATMWELERVSTGIFNKEKSINLEDLNKDNFLSHLTSIEAFFDNLPELKLDTKFERLAINGVAINDFSLTKNMQDEILYKIYGETNNFLGIGKKHKGAFKIIKLFI